MFSLNHAGYPAQFKQSYIIACSSWTILQYMFICSVLQAGLRIRIRIQSGQWIRIRIQEGENDPQK
jgi:hypothetical protein